MNYVGHEYQKEKVKPVVPDLLDDDYDKDENESEEDQG